MDIDQGMVNTLSVLLSRNNVKATIKSNRKTFVMKSDSDKILIPYLNINVYIKKELPEIVLDYLYDLSKIINKYYDLDIFKYFGIIIIEYGKFSRTFNIFYRESKYGRMISGKQTRKGFIVSINLPLKKEELIKEVIDLNKKYLSKVL